MRKYKISGRLKFTVYLGFSDSFTATKEQAEELNSAIENAVAYATSQGVEYIELVCGYFEEGDEISYDDVYCFEFEGTVYGDAEEEEDVYYLANGDPGYPGDYEEEWDYEPYDVDEAKVIEEFNSSVNWIHLTSCDSKVSDDIENVQELDGYCYY